MPQRTGDARLALIALALAAAAPARAADEVRVEASADRTEISQDQVVKLRIRVEADEAPASIDLHEAELPFTIVSRSQSREASFAIGGGGAVRLRRVTVLELTLSPRRAGDLVIPPVTAVVKGARHESEPVAVKVRPGSGGSRAPAARPDKRGGSWHGWERDLALEVALDRREVFIGEQVTASVSLLSPVGVTSYEGYQPPLYDGFWVEDVETPQRLASQLRTVNGVPMRAYLVQKVALFPTRAGTIELGPFQLDVAVRVGSAVWPFSEVRRARRRSAPTRIEVKPLPPGAPAGFDGVNVGTWKVEASASEPKVAAGQPVTVRITASGEGNVRALALPRLPELPAARRFEPSTSEQVKRRGGRIGGSRTLETVVVPERPGELVVPPLAWPTFDPAARRYEVARTRELRIEVLPGPGAPPPGPDPGAELAAALRPIRTDGALAGPRPPPWTRPPFLAVLVLPPGAFAAAVLRDVLRRRSRSAAPARRARDAGRVARRRLRTARRRMQAGDGSAALEEATRALEGFASDRLGRPVAGMTRGDLGAVLAEAGARPVAVTALQVALDACDAARFGEGAPAEEVVALAERALALLDPPRRAAARAEVAR